MFLYIYSLVANFKHAFCFVIAFTSQSSVNSLFQVVACNNFFGKVLGCFSSSFHNSFFCFIGRSTSHFCLGVGSSNNLCAVLRSFSPGSVNGSVYIKCSVESNGVAVCSFINPTSENITISGGRGVELHFGQGAAQRNLNLDLGFIVFQQAQISIHSYCYKSRNPFGLQYNVSIDFTCKVKQSAVGIPANKLVAYFSRVGNFVGFFALLHFLSGNQAAVSRVKCYSEHLLRPFSGVSDVVSNAFGSIKLSFAIKPTYKGIALACVHCRSSN